MKLKENQNDESKKIKVKKGKVEKLSAEVLNKPTSLKTISPAIFDYFKNLTNSEEKFRLSSSFQLIQHISRAQQDDKREKEFQYALKRLVRGVGASTTDSRAGFFTTLVVFLKSISTTVKDVLDITKKELHVGGAIVDKEDADAIVGQILVCGALLRSKKLDEATNEDVEEIIKILLASTKHRTYHTSLAFSFLIEILNEISEDKFISSVWPHVEPEIIKPWPKQTINTVHCLFIVQKNFPTVVSPKYLKSKFSNSQILHPGNYKLILKIFWDSNNPNIILHEAFNILGLILAESKHLVNFWTTEVAEHLKTSNKLKEIQTLKILSDIIDNLDTKTVNISDLLTTDFIKMMVTSIQTIKNKKENTLKAFYDDFFESLNNKFSQVTDEHEKASIIKKLILYPGTLSLEKYTSSRILHQLIFQLKEDGIKEIFEVYKNIFMNKISKNSEDSSQIWLISERQNAGFILQSLLLNKNIQNAEEWRIEQLKVFLKFGLFHVSEDNKVTKKENAGKCSEEFGEQMKNMFYSCLQAKHSSLKEERNALLNLAKEVNTLLSSKNISKKIRGKFEENTLKVWENIFNKFSTESKKKDDHIQIVFDILLLHMGLQLFRDAEMANSAILDLEKCMERTKNKNKNATDDEPQWIEVVTDLFLHLMSHNNGCLRHVVNSVFPHLCGHLNLTSVHQILSVLDMKNTNPLESGNNEDNDETEDEESDQEEDDDDVEDNNEEDGESDNDEEEDDDDDIEEEEEEESTDADKLRNAVSIALGSSMNIDDDQGSIDLNDLTEEEGKKLDEALSAAFKSLKKTSQTALKKSKSHRIQTTTVLHFRIRVLDLLDLYIQNKPSQLVTIEIMLSLFNMLEFCNEPGLKPLQNKIEKLLHKLTAVKQFANDEEGDINEDNICDFVRIIVEKKVPTSIFEFYNKLRTKCCLFLINCCKTLPKHDKVTFLLREFIDDFIISRNPKMNISVLNEIFKLKWEGVSSLIQNLVSKGLQSSVRSFRRIQVLEILSVFLKSFEDKQSKLLKALSKEITVYVNGISSRQSQEISAKEFNTALDVIFVAQKKFSCLDKIIETVQNIRRKIKLESSNNYSRICNLYKVALIKNSEVAEEEVNDQVDGSNQTNGSKCKENPKNDGKKRKNTSKQLQKEKKLKKEARMQISSKGFSDHFEFSSNEASVDVDMSDGSEIESDNED